MSNTACVRLLLLFSSLAHFPNIRRKINSGMTFSMLQLLRDVPIACVDTETTGASAAFGHKIIEIGIVRIENGREVGRYEQLVNPKRRITAGVTAFTGITQAMVDGQPRFADQLEP